MQYIHLSIEGIGLQQKHFSRLQNFVFYKKTFWCKIFISEMS